MPHRARRSRNTMLDLLGEGVHVLPVVRRADGAMLVVVCNALGEVVGEPLWVPQVDLADKADELIDKLRQYKAGERSGITPLRIPARDEPEGRSIPLTVERY